MSECNSASEMVHAIISLNTEITFLRMYLQENEMIADYERWSNDVDNRLDIQLSNDDDEGQLTDL